MQFSRSHRQPLQKPGEAQEMLKIPDGQSCLVSRTFSVHIRIWMFTPCTMHLVSTFTSEPRKEIKEVNNACRCSVAQSTAKILFSDFQNETTTHFWHGKEPPSQRTAIWRLNASTKISLTKLGKKQLSSWATSDFPHDPTTRMTRSHAPFAQTFPSANETATTKPPHRSSRHVKDTCWPIVTCFSNIQRTYKNMDVHSVHNASCLYVHVWAQERDEEVDYSFVAAELQNPLQRFCSLSSKQRPQLMCWHGKEPVSHRPANWRLNASTKN